MEDQLQKYRDMDLATLRNELRAMKGKPRAERDRQLIDEVNYIIVKKQRDEQTQVATEIEESPRNDESLVLSDRTQETYNRFDVDNDGESATLSTREKRIAQVANDRLRGLVPVLERPLNLGNFDAVCRTAEALGCDLVELIIEPKGILTGTSGASVGARKWIKVNSWHDTASCLVDLKRRGFQIVVTSLCCDAVLPDEIDWTRDTAIVFGNERNGASDEAKKHADKCVRIPTYGMVQSLNLGVAAGILLHKASTEQRRSKTVADRGAHAKRSSCDFCRLS